MAIVALQRPHGLPVVVSAALAHYQFETLHPFSDCNGRVGRLVILLQLLRCGALDQPALTISPWLLRRREQYQDLLLNVSRSGDWDAWIRFFARGIQEQCRSHVSVAQQLITWIATVRQRLHERHWTGTIALLAEALIDWPIVSNALVREKFSVTEVTAQNAIDRLVKLEVLEELTGGHYARVYGAREIMRLLENL